MFYVLNQDAKILFGPAPYNDCQEELETMLEAWRDHGQVEGDEFPEIMEA
jgi:hypothetical protein